MASQPLQVIKAVSALPSPLAPNTFYLVRVGKGYDLYATDTTGRGAYKINVSPSQLTDSISIANGGTGATTLAAAQAALGINDNKVLLPQKIGASQRWYQRGLIYGADYPYPYSATTSNFSSGQYFIPFTALEDAKISALEIQCTTAQSNGTVSLGIYASDSNNDVSNPLFTSNPIDCSVIGTKNAPCNVQIAKGKVYWLSSMVIGNPGFYRNAADSLMPIKGNTVSGQGAIIGYYIASNTSMAQSAPTNKSDMVNPVPRVMFLIS